MEQKYCKKCRKTKDATSFHKAQRYKGGLHCHCKDCAALLNKEYRNKNREKLAIKDKERKNKNKEAIAIKKKENYEKNKEAILRYCNEYRNKNQENIALRNKEYRDKNKEKIALYRTTYLPRSRELREKLADTYIKKLLANGTGIPHSDIPEPLVETKRLTIQIKRLLKELNQ